MIERSRLVEIGNMPRSITGRSGVVQPENEHRVYRMQLQRSVAHESVCRAYHILEQVKGWLELAVPADVILALVEFMESGGGE